MRAMMFSLILVCLMLAVPRVGVCQSQGAPISEMRWGRDYNLHVKLANDSNYVVDVRGLYHTGDLVFNPNTESTTYYPVNLDEEFINYIKQRKLEVEKNTVTDTLAKQRVKTLWSSLHGTLGGGYVHFVNSLIFSLESQQLNLSDAIMKRPVTNWKPKPMTKTYKRTKKWEYYIPFEQRQAKREYRKRVKEKDLKDLQGVPERFLNLFLKTSQKEYDVMRKEGKRTQVAQIDLIRLLLGAKYLGADQIDFIQNRVETAVVKYNLFNLPSVIIFDDFKAAVAMSLDMSGYKIDYVVFQDFDRISDQEQSNRIDKIEAIIDAINEANDRVFKKRLSTYYN